MALSHEPTFAALRDVLRAHAGGLVVSADTATRFCLEGALGPATLAGWGGRARRPTIPVAWVERRRGGVSFHLMALGAGGALAASVPPALRARMSGKTCFSFREPDVDAERIAELAELTAAAIAAFRRAGFITG